MKTIALFSALVPLAMLVACDEASPTYDGYEATEAPDGYDNWWDDPENEPDIDRAYSQNGAPRSLPLGSSGVLSTAYATWKGETANDRVGICVSGAGDLNGDGREDIIVGSLYAAGSAANDGLTYMNRAPFSSGNLNLGASKGRYFGATSSKAGQAVSGGGDTNNDGKDDFVIGALQDSTAGTYSGSAYVVLGFTRGQNTLPSGSTQLTGDGPYDRFGQAVDVVEDINGDGYDDVFVSAPEYDVASAGNEGAAYLFYGPISATTAASAANATFVGETAGDNLGTRIKGVGDTDGDGVGDLVIAARYNDTAGNNAGAVYIITSYTENSQNSVADASAKLTGEFEDDQAGNQIAEAGDVNGDGYNDFLVGGLANASTGGAYVVTGPQSGENSLAAADTYFTGQLTGDQFGSALAAADIDGDGTTDIIVGANRQGTDDRGAFYVFLNPAAGHTSAYNADIKVLAAGAGDYLGSWIDVAHDTEFDGTDTLIVGASGRGDGTNLPQKGVVYLFQFP